MALPALQPAQVPAQILDQMKKPIDLTKQADVNGKNITFSDLHYQTISQPTRVPPASSAASNGDLQLQRLDLNEVRLKSAETSAIPEPVLPQVNFTAKRAVADKMNDQTNRQLDQSYQNAPITNRQIRPFAPGGEEELRKQLNKLHP
jgi:hypothetical protein